MPTISGHLKNFHEAAGEYHTAAAAAERNLAAKYRRMAALHKRRKADLADEPDEDAQELYDEVGEEIAEELEKKAAAHLKLAAFHGKAAADVAMLDPTESVGLMTRGQPHLPSRKAAGLDDDPFALVPDHVRAVIPAPEPGLTLVPRAGQPQIDSHDVDLAVRKIVGPDLENETEPY